MSNRDDEEGRAIAAKLRTDIAILATAAGLPSLTYYQAEEMVRCPACGHGVGIVDTGATAGIQVARIGTAGCGLVHKCARCRTLLRLVTHAA